MSKPFFASESASSNDTATTPRRPRTRLAVFKFASCDGCQLSLLDCENELLAVAEAVEIAWFPEASSRLQPGPYDIALVEGSITTPHDAQRILEVRQSARIVVTIGACATAGGIQSLKNWADMKTICDAFTLDQSISPRWPLPLQSPTTSRSTMSYEVARSVGISCWMWSEHS